jgi:hypothetical protein
MLVAGAVEVDGGTPSSSRVIMVIRLIIDLADQNRPGANQMRQRVGYRQHFR